MSSREDEARFARMRAACELHELMIDMRREALVREHPDESPQQIESRLRAWILKPEPVPRRFRSAKPFP